MNHTIVINL
ncbi:hypothetical protein BLOT_005569 [Blomia tropicalis]|nr:hypothetical protein BLOT_005569 [Blomia tropicalis]